MIIGTIQIQTAKPSAQKAKGPGNYFVLILFAPQMSGVALVQISEGGYVPGSPTVRVEPKLRDSYHLSRDG